MRAGVDLLGQDAQCVLGDLRQLAEATGTSHGYLSRIARGEHIPRREMFDGIANCLAQDDDDRRSLVNARDVEELVIDSALIAGQPGLQA